MQREQVFRLRAPGSGREALAPVDPDRAYVDRATGEEMQVVAMALPLSPSDSALPRTPENLQVCPRCEQLIGIDVNGCASNCPFTNLRQPPTDAA